MTTSVYSYATSPFAVLQSVAQSTAAMTQNLTMANIAQDLQNQLTRQLAAIQQPTDQVSIDLSQNRIAALQSKQSTISKLETKFGNNGSILADMANQLNLMSQAVGKDDNTVFDNASSALQTDYSILTPADWNPIFQADGIAQFKTNGISLQSSAAYDLSSTSGQDAATADITTIQNVVQSILKVNGANQTVAASQLTAYNGQINSLQSLQTQQQQANSAAVNQQTQQLQTNMQNQLHLIQLSLGQANSMATALSKALNPPSPVTSVFGALTNAIGETAATAETQLGSTPAIMSLFA